MSFDSLIDLEGADEKNLSCMARCTLDFGMRFWDDDEKTEPADLTGSRFDMTVTDKAGNEIITLSTEDSGGLTIDPDNTQDLLFEKTAEEMDLVPGVYRYVLQRTVTKTFAVSYGDFIIRKNTNPLISV